ncbi:MAG: hypothetical protein WCS77_01630 [Elusimicrobiaceae bacterium]
MRTLLAFLLFAPSAFGAQAGDITERGSVFTHRAFCSADGKICRTMTVRVPDGYGKANTRYPAVYLLNGEPDPAVFESTAIVVSFGNSGPADKSFADFLCRETVPYIENNYSAAPSQEGGILLAAGKAGSAALYLLRTYDTFTKAALFSPALTDDDIAQLRDYGLGQKPVKLWLDASLLESGTDTGALVPRNVENLVKLAETLRFKDLSFPDNFATYIEKDDIRITKRLRYAMAYLGAEKPAPLSAKGWTSWNTAGQNRIPQKLFFAGRMKFPQNFEADCFPETVKSSPPYFGFDGGFIALRSGAETGPVKLTASCGTTPFEAAVSVKKSQPANYPVKFILQAGRKPPDSKIYVSTFSAETGVWQMRAYPLEADKKTGKYSCSCLLPAGTALNFKFSLGTASSFEKTSAGLDVPFKAARITGKTTLSYKVDTWFAPKPARAQRGVPLADVIYTKPDAGKK